MVEGHKYQWWCHNPWCDGFTVKVILVTCCVVTCDVIVVSDVIGVRGVVTMVTT